MTTLALLVCLAIPQDDPAELMKQVDEAIVKGADWLKKQQKSEGDFGESSGPTYGGGANAYHNKPGITAFSLLALLKSDVPHNDPVITRGFAFLQEYVDKKENPISNYDRGVILMAVEALHESIVAEALKKAGKKTAERVGDFKEPKYALSPQSQKFVLGIVKTLQDEQTRNGGWRYGKGFGNVGSDEDISATQIVLLGLKSASRMRVPVDTAGIKKAMDFVMGMQEKDGPKVERPKDIRPGDRRTYVSMGDDRARGWAYIKRGGKPEEEKTSGSMTCAAVGCLIIAKSIVGRQIPRKACDQLDQCIYDGFAWLMTNWSVTENPQHGKSRHYYHLYGLERVGSLGLYEKVGSHYWYKEGAEVLLKDQVPDGSWNNRDEIAPTDIIDTCYALLFLRRGTVPVGDVMTPRADSKPR
jgi:hypothetical protein